MLKPCRVSLPKWTGRSARKTVGHADQAMTSHCTHIGAQAHRAAAEAVAALVDGKIGS